MPPRSVCLNVFTSSLGNDIGLGKERGVNTEVREVEDKMEGVEDAAERGRHDSVQGSPNDTIVATQPYNHSIANPLQPSLPLSMNDNMAKIHKTSTKTRDSPLPQPSFSSQDRNSSTSGMISTRCSTCANAPAPGSSLSRCSRCKNAFYCSKTCQKTAWRSHKFECEPIGSTRGFSPSSAMNTPDISTPASPVAHDVTLEPSIMLNVSAGEAASAPFTETHVHRLPQSSAQWHLDYTKYKPSFQIANVSMLGDYLEDAYRLYADEHGGFPSNFDVALDEYRAYINAVSERVELPFILDHVSKANLVERLGMRNFESSQGNFEPERNPSPGADSQSVMIAEFRRINEMVYGPGQSEQPPSR